MTWMICFPTEPDRKIDEAQVSWPEHKEKGTTHTEDYPVTRKLLLVKKRQKERERERKWEVLVVSHQ